MSDETGRNARQRSIRMLGGNVKERVWARPLATRCLSLLLRLCLHCGLLAGGLCRAPSSLWQPLIELTDRKVYF